MKKILLIIVTLFISDIAYSQVQRGNNFQRRGMIDRDQIRERLEMRRSQSKMEKLILYVYLILQRNKGNHSKKLIQNIYPL